MTHITKVRKFMTCTNAPTDTFVEVNGLKLHYTDWNSSTENTTLLIHGLGKELHVWDSVAADLARTRRVICVDLRGHGLSDWSKEGYALESFVDDLSALLAHLNIAEIQIVGHSVGARVAIMLAATWSGQVGHVLLSDAGPELSQETAQLLCKASMQGMPSYDSEHGVLAALREAHPDWRDEFHQISLRHEYRRNWIGKFIYRADPEILWMVQTEWVEGNPRLWESWEQIQAPITVLWASESAFLDEEIVARMRVTQPTFELRRPTGSHFYLRQAPEEFLRYAQEALAG
ncbi:alpha/beta hydrolase [Rhodococcus sp. T2V]|uniref:alpha/beta fold hydrolase n=1 Tax=Rhodococcus sp. T2V TaxID=3034164 RepID=UPI0023E23A56|nr:alpha/beta hydrolase [Rhodococcus sp. T2V]MDF3313282.1 alpha/beta hydrolase [Rhodococcus sp. T2V]